MVWRWAAAGLIIGCIAALPVSSAFFFDDTYIHIRLAEHLLVSGAPYFNPGVAYKTGSSSGYIFLIAALLSLLNPIQAVLVVQATTIILTFGALGWLVPLDRQHIKRRAFTALAMTPLFLQAAYAGMETPLACLMLTGAALAWHYHRQGLAILCFALAACLRIEYLAPLTMALLFFITYRKLKPAHLLGLLPLLLVFASDIYFYQDIIPAAAWAKSRAYHFPWAGSIVNAISLGIGVPGRFISIFLFFAICSRLVPILKHRRLELADILLVSCLCLIIAWACSRSLIFEWYPCLLIFPLGLAMLLYRNASKNTINLLLIALGWAMLLNVALIQLLRTGPEIRTRHYITIAQALYRHCPSCTLLSSEIGGLGYAFKGTVHDALGIGDPEARRYHPLEVPTQRNNYSIGAIPPAYAEKKQADFIVSMPIFSAALRASPFITNYQKYTCPLGSSAAIFGDGFIEVFSQQPIPESVLGEMRCVH